MNLIKKGFSFFFLFATLLLILLWVVGISDPDVTSDVKVGESVILLSLALLSFLLTKYLGNNPGRKTLKITLLGASGVGKTSLLAAIYDQFDQIIGQTNLQLTPEPKTRVILEERLKELKSIVGDGIRAKEGIRGSAEPRNFLFDLGKTGISSSSLRLEFQDFPGGYIDSAATPEQKQSIEKFLKESAVVLIAIDTPALMEQRGEWHKYRNNPEAIRNLFTKTYRDLNSPKLVIFAPIKCEKYVKTEKEANNLLRRVKEEYSTLLDFFHAEALLYNVAVVVTPVQTVGSVSLSSIKVENGKPIFYFAKEDPDRQYEPKDSDQPLRYLLRFLLRLHLDNRRVPLIEPILSLFGKDAELEKAVREYASGCKDTDGFAVLQGSGLLTINRN